MCDPITQNIGDVIDPVTQGTIQVLHYPPRVGGGGGIRQIITHLRRGGVCQLLTPSFLGSQFHTHIWYTVFKIAQHWIT